MATDFVISNMFPYPQYSNRIYVNPKFSGGNQQQLLQQQQLAQQRQYMEMEAKRMTLLQHQQQLLLHKSRQEQRAIELDQKRKETAEMMRKRRESKNTDTKASFFIIYFNPSVINMFMYRLVINVKKAIHPNLIKNLNVSQDNHLLVEYLLKEQLLEPVNHHHQETYLIHHLINKDQTIALEVE